MERIYNGMTLMQLIKALNWQRKRAEAWKQEAINRGWAGFPLKKVAVLVVALLLALSAHAQTPGAGTDHGISGSWSAPTGYSSTLTLNGYTATITPPPGVTSSVTVGQCAAGATTNCIASGATTFTWKPGGVIYCGTWTISVVANYTDSVQGPEVSVPLTTTMTEACPLVLSPVTGLSATAIP